MMFYPRNRYIMVGFRIEMSYFPNPVKGLDETVLGRTDFFGKEVDYVCISDNYWLGKDKPCLTYGLRGICYFYLTITGCKADLHSGLFGGAVQGRYRNVFRSLKF